MKKTGSATAAAAIATHGFRIELLASASAPCSCTRPEVEIGQFVTYTKTYQASNLQGIQNTTTWFNNIFSAAVGFQGQESLLQQQGFTCTPPNGFSSLKERSHNGERTLISPPAQWKMSTPSWGPPYLVGSVYKIDCTITGSVTAYKTVPCP